MHPPGCPSQGAPSALFHLQKPPRARVRQVCAPCVWTDLVGTGLQRTIAQQRLGKQCRNFILNLLESLTYLRHLKRHRNSPLHQHVRHPRKRQAGDVKQIDKLATTCRYFFLLQKTHLIGNLRKIVSLESCHLYSLS